MIETISTVELSAAQEADPLDHRIAFAGRVHAARNEQRVYRDQQQRVGGPEQTGTHQINRSGGAMIETITTVELSAAQVADLALPTSGTDAVEELRSIESLKCALEARQARLALVVEADQRDRAHRAEVPSSHRSRGVGAQIALARRVSPNRGSRLLGLAKVLATELPHTWTAFRAGRISEWRATIIARETACLSLEHRGLVDKHIAADPDTLEIRGDHELIREITRLSAELDAAALVKRRQRAESDRRVSIRPAPDSMVYLTALLPMKTGIAAYASLKAAAATAVGTGQATGTGQAMADELVRRLTGCADLVPPVTLNLVMTPATLFDGSAGAGNLDGFPIPADVARELLADNLDANTKVRVRRLFAAPDPGDLVAMESRGRLFPDALADLVRIRDQFCRTPWCDAQIRHIDHVDDHNRGGPTSVVNGQGLCESCNHAKQAPGWAAETISPSRGVGRHTVETRTPTGHRYRSTAPPLAS